MTEASSFWDRRKAAVAAELQAEADATEAAALEKAQADKTDEEILVELDLPDPDQMQQGDDFSAFMAKAVPEHIRKRALRTLWRSNPVLACVDGLNDYDDDYLTGSFGNGPIKTTYQVGKGMLAHLLEMERQADAPQTEAETQTEVLASAEITEAIETIDAAATPELTDPEVNEKPAIKTPRMQFAFEGDEA